MRTAPCSAKLNSTEWVRESVAKKQRICADKQIAVFWHYVVGYGSNKPEATRQSRPNVRITPRKRPSVDCPESAIPMIAAVRRMGCYGTCLLVLISRSSTRAL